MKICIITSPGGHLFQAYMLKDWWKKYDRVWVSLNSPDVQHLLKKEKVIHAFGPENRNLLNFIKNFFLAFIILLRVKPQIVFSTGAGVAPPFFIWARLFGIKTIYLEPYDFIDELSLTGKLVKPFSIHFLVQHKKLVKKYSRVEYQGVIV